jgi:AraC family transcriptional regulator
VIEMKVFDDYCLENMRPDVAPPSNNAIFGNIRIDDYETPPQSLDHTPCHNTVIISRSSLPLVQLEMGGERRDQSFTVGDVMIYPAGVKQSACWDQNNAYTVITIETNFFNSTAHDHRDSDYVDLLSCFPQSDPLICGVAQTLSGQIQHLRSVNLEYIDQVAATLVVHLLEKYSSVASKLPESSHALSSKQLKMLHRYIEDNLSRKIPLQELANLVGVSLYYFINLFKRSTGKTPAQYIKHQRLKKAIHLLHGTNMEIGLIAQKVGFYDHSHLCRVFRDCLSATPDQYRKN